MITIAPHTSTAATAISKLLLNAWSAEYALRIKPVQPDRLYLNESLHWLFPQAYFSMLFSARARLTLDGSSVATAQTIEACLRRWAQAGFYGDAYNWNQNPATDLAKYRPGVLPQHAPMSGPEAAALQLSLIRKVYWVNAVHETYVADQMGHQAYRALINKLPEYLRSEFVGQRASQILGDPGL